MNTQDAASIHDRRILICLWVVAMIIPAGVIINMFRSSMPRGCRRSLPVATAIALESAINTFHIEYGILPCSNNRVTTNSPEGLKLLNTLLGSEAKSDKALNSRALKFLAVKEGKNHKNGLIYSDDGRSVEGLFDPWGSPYTVILNTEYKESLQFTIGSKTIDLKGRRSTVFSPGPDKKFGTGDDVCIW